MTQTERIWATVPQAVYEALNKRAEAEGRSVSNLVAFILCREVKNWSEYQQPQPENAKE